MLIVGSTMCFLCHLGQVTSAESGFPGLLDVDNDLPTPHRTVVKIRHEYAGKHSTWRCVWAAPVCVPVSCPYIYMRNILVHGFHVYHTMFLGQSPRSGTAESKGMNTFKGSFNMCSLPEDIIIYTSILSMHFPVPSPTSGIIFFFKSWQFERSKSFY